MKNITSTLLTFCLLILAYSANSQLYTSVVESKKLERSFTANSLLFASSESEKIYQLNPETSERKARVFVSNLEMQAWEGVKVGLDFSTSIHPIHWLDREGNLNIVHGQDINTGELGKEHLIYATASNEWKKSELSKEFQPRLASTFCQDEELGVWIFGGKASSIEEKYLNDLWYTNNGEWKKIEAKSEESPSPRILGTLWHLKDKLVLYGGMANENGGLKRKADLWYFYFESNSWEKIDQKGEEKIEAQHAFPATLSYQNHPSLRFEAKGWKENDENLWLYGGQTVYSQERISHDAVLWKFNTKEQLWTFYPTEQRDFLIKPKLVLTNRDKSLTFIGCQMIKPLHGYFPSNIAFTFKLQVK